MSAHDESSMLDIVRYAEVLAHVRHFPADKQAEVVGRLGVRRSEWDAAAKHWRKVRDAERTSGKLDITIKFGRVMSETKARLLQRKPTIESLGPWSGLDGAEERPRQQRVPEMGQEVVATPIMTPNVDPIAAGTLPPMPPPPLHGRPSEEQARWARWAGPVNPAATAGLDDSAIRRAILPFLQGSPTPQFFAEADAQGKVARGHQPPSIAGQTLELGASLPLPGAPHPAAATLDLASRPSMSLEQYAALCAELSVFPSNSAVIYQRYGVADPAQLKAVNDAFALHFRADPAQRQRWQSLIVHYGDWFRRQPPT